MKGCKVRNTDYAYSVFRQYSRYLSEYMEYLLRMLQTLVHNDNIKFRIIIWNPVFFNIGCGSFNAMLAKGLCIRFVILYSIQSSFNPLFSDCLFAIKKICSRPRTYIKDIDSVFAGLFRICSRRRCYDITTIVQRFSTVFQVLKYIL